MVNRTVKALSGWLGPAWGGGLELKPDLDQIEALAPERVLQKAGEEWALWTRLGKAEFLSDDEKRAAVGYGDRAETGLVAGGQPKGQSRTAKFNPNHDEQGRFTTADGAGGGADPFADTLPAIVVGQGEEGDGDGEDGADSDGAGTAVTLDGSTDDDDLLHLVGGLRTQRITVGGRTYRATEAQATQLSQAVARADNALRRVRERDPEWRAGASLTDPNSIEGAIASSRALAQQAEARLLVLERGGLPLGFNSREDYAAFGRSARTALNEAGFPEAEPYIRGSAVTGFSYSTGNAFDVGRRSDYDIAIVSPRLFEVMRQSGVRLRSGGGRTEQFNWENAPSPKLAEWLRSVETQYGREASIMIYRSQRDLELRRPYLPID